MVKYRDKLDNLIESGTFLKYSLSHELILERHTKPETDLLTRLFLYISIVGG
jgi:hypothetical protein